MADNFKDLAIILTWPDATIRGDEKWMMFFKKIGLVKNLNFKVGHTGIIIIDHRDGNMLFYDFGRYITPRGYGRARSYQSDPLLKINIKAIVKENKILNIEEIVAYLEQQKLAMYGEGKLYFSIVKDINYEWAKSYGDECVLQGTYPYGAVARSNNNCSRFITRMLIKSSRKYHFWHSINLPETGKASPISNLVNAVSDRMIYSYTPEEGLKSFKMNRFQSLWFLIKQLGDNVYTKKAKELPNDQIIGGMDYQSRPATIPENAMYLGGVGDGAWFHIKNIKNQLLIIKRYTSSGQLEYIMLGESEEKITHNEDFHVTYDSHKLFTHITQNNKKIRINHIKELDIQKLDLPYSEHELYA